MIRLVPLARALAFAVLATIAAGCGEEVVVRTTTRVDRDGGATRRCEIAGTDADGARPEAADWVAEHAKIRLARRDAWAHVAEAPGRITVEAFFPTVRDLPPLLAHRTERGMVVDRAAASLAVDDLVVLERRVWHESVGDPFGATEVSVALDEILGMTREALEAELRRTFGSDLDVAPVGRYLTKKVRPLLVDLLPSIRRWKSAAPERAAAPGKGWGDVLTRHGVTVADPNADLFAPANLEAVSAWMRRGIAAAVSTRAQPIDAAQLQFWPEGEDASEETAALAQRVFGGAEAAADRLAPAASALAGFYGDAGGTRFRFETQLILPGRLVRTNGTPDREGVVWLHRDEDLTGGERVFEAETVELRDDALRSLGARRELDAIQLLQLTDLLTRRDPEGSLRELLAAAVERGRLDWLRGEASVPEALRSAARELADVLDPAVEAVRLP